MVQLSLSKLCSFISAVVGKIYKVFLQNRFKWLEAAERLRRQRN